MQRRQLSKEFKQEAVALGEQIGMAQAAADLGVTDSLLYKWRQQLRCSGDGAFPGHGRLPAPDEEVGQLQREVRQLREEREILKKAAVFFAQQSR